MKSLEYSKVKPHMVIEAMREFSNPPYKVDVLKVEVPVIMNFIERDAIGETAYSQKEVAAYFKGK